MADEHSEGPLAARVTRAAAWTVGARWGVRLIGLFSTIILARLLNPEDFGLVALAFSVWTIFEVFLEFGMEGYLIRHRELVRSDYDTVWTLTLVRGALIAALVLAAAPTAARLLDEPDLTQLFYVISGVVIVSSFKNVAVVDFQRDLRFDKEFTLLVSTKVISFVITLTAALILRNYWALILGICARHLTVLGLSYYMHPFRPRIDFSRWRKIYDFSVWLTLASALGAIASRIDYIVLRSFVGIQDVGFYTVGKEVASLPTTELVHPIGRALYPGFATLGMDIKSLGRAHLESTGLLFCFAMPAGIGVAVVAPDLVRVLFGAQWLVAGSILGPIALALTAQILSTNFHPITLVLGRTKLLFVRSVVLVTFKPGLMAFGAAQGGLEGAVWGICIAGLLEALMDTALIRYLVKFRLIDLITAIVRPVVAAGVMAIVCLIVLGQLPHAEDITGAALRLTVTVLLGIATFGAALLAQWFMVGRPQGPERRILDMAVTARLKLAGQWAREQSK